MSTAITVTPTHRYITKLTTTRYENVAEDGTFTDEQRGHVGVEPGIYVSCREGGCGLEECDCHPGCWVATTTGRIEDGTVEVMTAHFPDYETVDLFLSEAVRGRRHTSPSRGPRTSPS